MAKSLGGSLLIRNGDILDYCYIQSIQCLLEFCDKVVVCVVPTAQDGDNTSYNIFNTFELAIRSGQLYVRVMQDADWLKMGFQTKHRLSIYTNYAIEMLDTDYVFNLQSDEILDPSSYEWVRRAMDEGQEGYLCKRINLWGSPYAQLNVPHHRLPCSTEIVRLTKTCYRAYDDAESIAAPCVDSYLDKIKIWHMGFVRKREVHPAKIREMQGNIFKCGVDSKLEGMDVFDPWKWFDKQDVIPITGELPPLIKEWAKKRS
jgi:hypothetical protein